MPLLAPSLLCTQLTPAAAAAGITRLADVTGFDSVGVPVWQAIRPGARSLVVSQGKGRSHAIARLSALMESLELDAAERAGPGRPMTLSPEEWVTWSMLDRRTTRPDPGLPVACLDAVDLLTGRSLAVPLGLVSMDTTPGSGPKMGALSTGLGAGDGPWRARRKALCEVAERAASARFVALSPAERRQLRVDPATLPAGTRTAGWILARLGRAGVEPMLWDLTPLLGIPTFRAILLDGGRIPAPVAPALGQCAHPCGQQAVAGALLEAAQSRVTDLAGARDDRTDRHYRQIGRRTLAARLEARLGGPGRPMRHLNLPGEGPAAQEAALLKRLSAAGARHLALLPLARHGPVGIVKLLAPGLPDRGEDQA